MAKTRVLLLLHELSLTGAPRVALDLFCALSNKIEARLISYAGGPLLGRAQEIGPVHSLSDLPDGKSLSRRIHGRIVRTQWASDIARWKPQLIYVNSVASLPIAVDLGLPEVPVLLHVHEMGLLLETYARSHHDLLVHWPDRVIAVSNPVREDLIRCGISADRISTHHECIDLANPAFLNPTPIRPDGRFHVGGSGMIDWRKGWMLWLLAAVELKELLGAENVRFTWVGVGENRAGREFRETARKLKIDSLIDFVAITPDPWPHYQSFDVFAMTSMEDPCPIVVLENMLLGKPVVCFADSGGAPEEVGEAGVVVPEFSPRLMAEAIANLERHPAQRQSLGKAARHRVIDQFTTDIRAPQIWAEIEHTLHCPPRLTQSARRIQ